MGGVGCPELKDLNEIRTIQSGKVIVERDEIIRKVRVTSLKVHDIPSGIGYQLIKEANH